MEQNIRQCVGFGGVSVGAKALLNRLGAMAPTRDELPRSPFVGQRSTQLWGTLEVTTGNARDVGTDRKVLAAGFRASRLVLLLNPPRMKHQTPAGWWLLIAALGVQSLRKLTDK